MASVKTKEFTDSLNYPAANLRPLGKWPMSVPADPIIKDYTPFKGNAVEPKSFFYSIYFTAFDVRDYGADIVRYMKIFAPLSVKKVYLETYRDGYTADKMLLQSAREALIEEGYMVSGGVTTTHFSDRQKYNETPSATGCYSDREANKKMKKVFELTAEIFDEIIIDDWFFTNCECPECKKGRGKKSWSDYRGKLMCEAAKKYVIEPAKKVNKNVNLILKFPQWYERFHLRGYDLEKLIPLFDEISAGTETRNFKEARFMPTYGAMFFRYMKNLAPEKVKKAWFDPYMCTPQIYAEQLYQSILGGAQEVILFCAGILPQKLIRPLVEELIEKTGKMDRFSHFGKIFTVPMIRAANTEGDEMMAQYFLMLGVPAYMTDKHSFRDKIVILTEQSAKKEDYSALFNTMLKNRKYMFLTVGFARELKKHFEVEELKEEIKVNMVTYNRAEEPVRENVFIKYEIQGGKRIALVNRAYSFMSVFRIKNSNIWVLNTPYTTDTMEGHTGASMPEHYRFMLHNRSIKAAVQSAFDSYANIKLYDGIKTYYKHDI
ncbi:MAG: hypothetical protein LLG37_00925 [Spirochaetia bacterium]|nr:hypothetical protein [Spirochaetia bacterium]